MINICSSKTISYGPGAHNCDIVQTGVSHHIFSDALDAAAAQVILLQSQLRVAACRKSVGPSSARSIY
jgi:hypothetical protein